MSRIIIDEVKNPNYPYRVLSRAGLMYLSLSELKALRDCADVLIAKAPKAHVHAEQMMQYAKDATITDKPWELWEVNWNVNNPKWTTLAGNPKWCPDYEYRRKLDAMG